MKVKPLLLAALLAVASCKGAAHRPSVGLMATPPPNGRVIGFDPSVVGLPGAISDTVYDSAGIISWVKFGPLNTDWRPVPVSQFVTGDPSQAPGLKAPIGFVVTKTDGTASWTKSTSSDTGWVVNPGGGGSGSGFQDGGVSAPLFGNGQTITPLGIHPATEADGGYFSAADKTKLDGLVPLTDCFIQAASPVTDLTISSASGCTLNGDTDGNYDLDGVMIYPASCGGPSYVLRPFGGNDTNLTSYYIVLNASLVVAASTQSYWYFANASGTSIAHVPFQIHLTSKTGRARWAKMNSSPSEGAGIGFNNVNSVGITTDESTQITAVTIHSTVANCIGTGSTMNLRKLGQSQ